MSNPSEIKTKIFQIGFLLITSFCLCRCAKPNYVQETQSPPLTVANSNAIPTSCMLRFSYSKLCVDWRWEVAPQHNIMASMIVKIFRLNSFDESPILTNLDHPPQMTLEMPSMSYCSSPRIAEQLDTGTYRIKNIIFPMPGEWQLRLSSQSILTVKDEAKILWGAN